MIAKDINFLNLSNSLHEQYWGGVSYSFSKLCEYLMEMKQVNNLFIYEIILL